MKKIIALLLVCFFAVSFVACGGNGDESSSAFSNADASSKEESSEASSTTESSAATSSSDDSSATSSDDASSDVSGDASSDVSGETSSDIEVGEIAWTSRYVSWKVATGNGARTPDVVKADDATSLKISKFNDDLVAGDVGVFTYDKTGKTLDCEKYNLADFAVVVAKYDHESFSYVRDEFFAVGEATGTVSIPKDGFVVVIHKAYSDKINAISSTTNPLFPHGFYSNSGLDAKISSAKTAPVMDGVVKSGEYGKEIWDVKPDNQLVSYAQFEKGNYTATAKVYMTYDAEYFYLAVVVNTPSHDNTATAADPSSMWKYTCIQVNFSSYGRDTAYLSENWDWGINQKTTQDNAMRQYGFGVTNDGESLTCVWQGDTSKTCENFKVIREGQTTTYEAAIKWSDLNKEGETFAPKKGDKVGISVSFNLGSLSTEFKNITLRDGGGIIGINDWSKIPTITLA